MDLSFLPIKISAFISGVDLDKLYEIRIRQNRAVTVFYENEFYYLRIDGLNKCEKGAVVATKSDIDYIIDKVSEYSFYSVNDRVKEGYLTTEDGIRIGLAGTCIYENGKILTIKDFTSLVIRLPHNVLNSAKEVYELISQNRDIKNTLLISPPRLGKTTVLKDLIGKISSLNINVVVFDERGEFGSVKYPEAEVIKYANKLTAFDIALRALSPTVIITDELISKEDWECVKKATYSGVKIVASCHGLNVDDVINKDFFLKGIFDVYVALGKDGIPGKICGVYDRDLKAL